MPRRGKFSAALRYAEKALKIEEEYKDADFPAATHINIGAVTFHFVHCDCKVGMLTSWLFFFFFFLQPTFCLCLTERKKARMPPALL